MIYVLDLDGTLVDSGERHCRLMQEILSGTAPEVMSERASGMRYDLAEFMEYKADGHSGLQYLTDCLGLGNEAAGQIMALWLQQIEEERWLKMDALYPDTLGFLDRLKQAHSKIIYLTARQNKEGLLQELKRLEIDGYADDIQVVPPADAGKAKKQVVETLLAKTGEDEGTVCIVGDTENEYHLAKELSLPCFLLNRGARSERYWMERGVRSIASLDEIEIGNET